MLSYLKCIFTSFLTFLKSQLWPVDCVLSMIGKIIIPVYKLWLHGLYGLYRTRCPLSPKKTLNLIIHTLVSLFWLFWVNLMSTMVVIGNQTYVHYLAFSTFQELCTLLILNRTDLRGCLWLFCLIISEKYSPVKSFAILYLFKNTHNIILKMCTQFTLNCLCCHYTSLKSLGISIRIILAFICHQSVFTYPSLHLLVALQFRESWDCLTASGTAMDDKSYTSFDNGW